MFLGHSRTRREEEDRASRRLGQGQQGLRLHLFHPPARNQRQADSVRRKRRPRWSRGSRRLRRSVEGVAVGVERRPEVTGCFVPHPGPVALQAGPALHLGRGRRCAGPVAHAEHRPHAQDALSAFTGWQLASYHRDTSYNSNAC